MKLTKYYLGVIKVIIIARHINGIIINALEYLLDDNNELIKFIDMQSAEKFLREHAFTDEEIYCLEFISVDQ